MLGDLSRTSPPAASTASRHRSLPRSALLVGNISPTSNRVSAELAQRLVRSGWSIISVSARPDRIGRFAEMVGAAWRCRDKYSVAQIDVYSGQAFLWAEAVCAVARRCGKPIVLSLHGGNMPSFAGRKPGRVRKLLSRGVVVTTPSRYLQEQMLPYRSDLMLLPNGLDLSSLNFRVRRRAEARLVWVRAFEELYNPTQAARVVARLAREYPSVEMTMVGPDKGDGSLQRFLATTRDLGVGDRITLTGRVPRSDVGSWLDRADIFLNTTTVDNTPGSVMEAMASGLCVVSTDVGGIPYLVEHRVDGLLSPSGDAEAMAENVRAILCDESLSAHLSTRAREKVEEFDWDRILPRWTAVLTSACAAQ